MIEQQADAEADAWMKEHGHSWGDGVLSASHLMRHRMGEVDLELVAPFVDAEREPATQTARHNGRRPKGHSDFRVTGLREWLQEGPRSRAAICARFGITDHRFRQAVKDYATVRLTRQTSPISTAQTIWGQALRETARGAGREVCDFRT